MGVTTSGIDAIANFARKRVAQLRGGRVGMAAASDVTYGIFRIREMRRTDIDIEVQVSRDLQKAIDWVRNTPASPA